MKRLVKINWHRLTRKSHRYLGIFIGIQFLAWTIGGLYFSWTDLDAVHGSDLIGPAPELSPSFNRVSLEAAIANLPAGEDVRFTDVRLLPFASDSAVYRIQYQSSDGRDSLLVDAATGKTREGLSEKEAKALAIHRYAGDGELANIRLIEATGPHDEYRELPLPAYAFTFNDERKTTLFVAPDHARLTSVRNGKWRAFDFLWMLHTMDYEGRDNFNNWILRGFSILGLATISSGFMLFFFSSPTLRRHLFK